MSLEDASYWAQIVAGAAVVISLIYVGLQLRQNTAQMQRGEANATFSQVSNFRLTLAGSPEIAQLWLSGLDQDATLDPTSQLRFESLIMERTWITFHMWDRTQRGLNLAGQWRRGSLPTLAGNLGTPGGAAWWARSKLSFPPDFAAAVDTALGALPTP